MGTKRIKLYNSIFLIILLIIAFVVFKPVFYSVFADTSTLSDTNEIQYTDVVTDLNADPNFDYDKYPVDSGDHGIYLIQVAESVNGELFVYMYAPSKLSVDIGCWIRFNTVKDSATGMKDYKLNFLSASGTLSKWLVQDFTVETSAIRYYNIVQLMRTWYTYLDGEPTDENGNIRRTKAYEVRTCITASTYKDKVVYESKTLETISITYKDPGRLYYAKTSGLDHYCTWSFYLAFDTDRRMEQLVEADVNFGICKYIGLEEEPSFIEEPTTKTLRADQYESVQYGTTFWTKKHTWSQIQSVSDFKANENLTDDAITNLNKAKWVLRYYTYNEYYNHLSQKPVPNYVQAYGLTILRLKFITDGVTYDLGCVDNKIDEKIDPQPDGGNHETPNPNDEDTTFDKSPWKPFLPGWSGDATDGDNPDNSDNGNWWTRFWDKVKNFFAFKVPDWVYWVLIAVAAVVLLPLIFVLVPGLFSGVVTVLKYVGKGLLWLITAPAKGIAKLVTYIKEKRNNS